MSKEFGNDFMTIIDDDGNEFNLELFLDIDAQLLQGIDHLLLAIPKNAAKNALEEIKYICRRMPFTNDDSCLSTTTI